MKNWKIKKLISNKLKLNFFTGGVHFLKMWHFWMEIFDQKLEKMNNEKSWKKKKITIIMIIIKLNSNKNEKNRWKINKNEKVKKNTIHRRLNNNYSKVFVVQTSSLTSLSYIVVTMATSLEWRLSVKTTK